MFRENLLSCLSPLAQSISLGPHFLQHLAGARDKAVPDGTIDSLPDRFENVWRIVLIPTVDEDAGVEAIDRCVRKL
jgi:hypothetical protein